MEASAQIRDVVIDIKGQQADDYPRVFLESGEEIREIPIRFEPKIRGARAGQRISFSRYLLNQDGRVFLEGDRVAEERLRAMVRTTEPQYPASLRMLDAARKRANGGVR